MNDSLTNTMVFKFNSTQAISKIYKKFRFQKKLEQTLIRKNVFSS